MAHRTHNKLTTCFTLCVTLIVLSQSQALGPKKPPSYQPWHLGLAFEQREQEADRHQSEKILQQDDHHKLYGIYGSYHHVGWLHTIIQGKFLTSNHGKITQQSYTNHHAQVMHYKTQIKAMELQSTLGFDYQPIHLKKVRFYTGLNYQSNHIKYPNRLDGLMQSDQTQRMFSIPIGVRTLLVDQSRWKLKMQLQYQHLMYGRESFQFATEHPRLKMPGGFALSLKTNYLIKPKGIAYYLEIAPYYQYSHYQHEPYHFVDQSDHTQHWLHVEDIQHSYGLICTLTFD